MKENGVSSNTDPTFSTKTRESLTAQQPGRPSKPIATRRRKLPVRCERKCPPVQGDRAMLWAQLARWLLFSHQPQTVQAARRITRHTAD